MLDEVTRGSAVTTALLAGLVTVCLWLLYRRPSGLPPFPKTPLPIVGNLLSLDTDPRHLFAKWRKVYGDVFSIYIGGKLTIVLNGFPCIREALVKNGNVFSERPDMFFFSQVMKGKGIVAASGDAWKSQRKFGITTLKELGFGKRSNEVKIREEVEEMVREIERLNGKKENLGRLFQIATSNILCSIVLGHRFDYDDEKFRRFCKLSDELFEALPNTGLSVFPFLSFLPGDMTGRKRAMACMKCFEEELIIPEIDKHYKQFGGTVDSFMSAYIKEIKECEEKGENVGNFRENFVETITALFLGGTSTTASTLQWLILFLLHNPKAQEQCFNEIKENVGMERLPSIDDKLNLPYVEATLAETQRRCNLAPTGIPRGVAEDIRFYGYTIPKGASILPNLDSVLMDPEVFPDPEMFRPERFLDKDGKFFKPEEFIPFSAGRRNCIGESLAKMELFLLGAALLQRFEFRQPKDEKLCDLIPVIGLTASSKPFNVVSMTRV